MKFAIFTHVVHKKHNSLLYAYEPYVREMNLWIKTVSETVIVASVSKEVITPIDAPYFQKNITLKEIPNFNSLTFKNSLDAFFKIPVILFKIYKSMKWADHIHLRCPGNIGLLASFVQVFFPSKPKTIKYAGNWDPNSKQPWSYRLQKRILSNTFLTRNAKVLVYGEWSNQSKNIIPFFTATYSEKECSSEQREAISSNKKITSSHTLHNDTIKFLYVGALVKGKQPLLSVKIVNQLKLKGFNVRLDMYGEGVERTEIENYIKTNNLIDIITLHGNASKDQVKKAYKKAHFLLFISKSEGWPKVVAEAMFWGCVPITSRVSCVPWMLADGKRGLLVNNDKEIVNAIGRLLIDKKGYHQMSLNAQKWSQQYTLEAFEKEIKKLLN